jgi:hypothetical protein
MQTGTCNTPDASPRSMRLELPKFDPARTTLHVCRKIKKKTPPQSQNSSAPFYYTPNDEMRKSGAEPNFFTSIRQVSCDPGSSHPAPLFRGYSALTEL